MGLANTAAYLVMIMVKGLEFQKGQGGTVNDLHNLGQRKRHESAHPAAMAHGDLRIYAPLLTWQVGLQAICGPRSQYLPMPLGVIRPK